MAAIDMRSAWNRLSAGYQEQHGIPSDSAHYGPWAPPESRLNLLGPVRGRRILEVGCGGGQCSVAFARQGACVAGLDLSDEQLSFARRLAEQEGVAVEFVQGSADDLSAFADGAWDLVFSAYALQYVANMRRCLAECSRVLRPAGRMVFSLDHPFRDCFVDSENDEMSIVPMRSYFDNSSMRWEWGNTGIHMDSYHFSIGQWCDMLDEAGFQLQRILEPAPPADMLDEIWPYDDPLASLRLIPQTIIFTAQKRESLPS
jgi:SAM-dependent methyltransferase